MNKKKTVFFLRKIVCYVIGLLFITIGINVMKMSSLGMSAVSSIPRACELLWGFSLGITTDIIYAIFILLQIALLRKRFNPLWLLGFPLTFVFGWMVNLTGIDPNAFGHLLYRFPRPVGYPMRFLYMAVAIVFIGIGVFLYLRPHFIPMPAEGLAVAMSMVTKKPFGDCKTFVDTAMIVVALILQIGFLGGFSSFTSDTVVVREGTILAALLVGQVVKLLQKKFGGWFGVFLGHKEKIVKK